MSQIRFPQVPFVGEDRRIALEWEQWLLNPQFVTLELGYVLGVASGGTGLSGGTPGGVLAFTGSDVIASSASLGAHKLVIGGGAGVPSTPVGLGTATTVLHGNASGDPSFGAVDLTADVTGLLPVANGGTAVATASAGTVFSGPVSGSAAAPSFQTLSQNACKLTAQTVTSSTVLVNDADLFFSVAPNETWMFRFHIHFGAGIKTTGMQINLAVPSGATGDMDIDVNTDATSGNENYLVDGTLGTTTDITTGDLGGGAANGHMVIHGFIQNGASSGTVQLQWAQSTSSATALTANAGSQVTAARLA